MKKITLLFAVLFFATAVFPQANSVNLASIAWEKGHLDNAYKNADAALQSPGNLDEKTRYKAHLIRGRAAARIAYNTLTKGEDPDTEKNASLALQAYRDFKEILKTGDEEMIMEIKTEFYKLGHALLLSGNDYEAMNTDSDEQDEILTKKTIECYSGTIELWELAKREKYKPYYYRGDSYLELKVYEKAVEDFEIAMSMFMEASRKNPDLGIGDLGYKLAYTQAGVFNQKEKALSVIDNTFELLEAEMQLAEEKKEKLGEIYDDIKTQYDYLVGELNSLKASVSK